MAIDDAALSRLTVHAVAVLEADPELHLTTLRDRAEFVERHVGESLQGAALIDENASGLLLDLGSGNGYPGLAVCAARPGLIPLLAESSQRKAAFLRDVVEAQASTGDVLCAHVQRPADLPDDVAIRVLVTRAMGGWEKIVPRLASSLARGGEVLLWAGRDAEAVLQRKAWRRFALVRRVPLIGRDRSWIYRLRLADVSGS